MCFSFRSPVGSLCLFCSSSESSSASCGLQRFMLHILHIFISQRGWNSVYTHFIDLWRACSVGLNYPWTGPVPPTALAPLTMLLQIAAFICIRPAELPMFTSNSGKILDDFRNQMRSGPSLHFNVPHLNVLKLCSSEQILLRASRGRVNTSRKPLLTYRTFKGFGSVLHCHNKPFLALNFI